MNKLLVCMACVSTSLACCNALAAHYRWLDPLPGNSRLHFSTATALSADGSTVIGRSGSDEAVEIEGYHWTAETGTLGMGSIGFPTGVDSSAVAITANGDTALGTLTDYGGTSGGTRMFTWQPGGTKHPIDLPAAGYERTEARAISADGSVISGNALTTGQDHTDPFVWTNTGGYQFPDLGPANARNRYVDVGGINADGSVVAGDTYTIFYGSGTKHEAYRWDTNGEFEYLGYLPGGDNERSYAHDISDDGSIVVGASDSANSEAGNGSFEAFRWTEEDGMVGLGDLPGGDFSSQAFAISGDGSVIVGESSIDTDNFFREYDPFIWTEEDGMRNLRDFFLDAGLDADFVASIRDVVDVSADGQTFVGHGYPPEPTFSNVWIVSLAALLGDYNADGFVSQADLDLVLLNWGDDQLPAGFSPAALGTGAFDGLISQNELDGVLLNWGDGSSPDLSAIPEPATAGILSLLTLAGLSRRARRLQ